MPPKKPQANAFGIAKRNTLGKLDKSPKGSLDVPIADLVHEINRHPDLVTTSSCSGRIVLFEAAASGRGGRWLLVQHATVSIDEVTAALDSPGRNGSDCSAAAGCTSFKVEPAILHVMCRDISVAKWLLQVALRAGFRESGLVLSESTKVMLAIRTTSNCLEMPVATSVPDGARKPLLSASYLEFVVSHANQKFEANTGRIAALHEAFTSAVAAAAACEECGDELKGSSAKTGDVADAKTGDVADANGTGGDAAHTKEGAACSDTNESEGGDYKSSAAN